MPITRWTPFNEVNRFFDDVFERLPARFNFDLAVDLYQEENNLIAEMSVPGIDVQNTDISVVDDILRIRGHREEKAEKQEKNYFSREIHRGSFERALRLPVPVIANETRATYKDGVLKVVMPLRKGGEHKKIAIEKG